MGGTSLTFFCKVLNGDNLRGGEGLYIYQKQNKGGAVFREEFFFMFLDVLGIADIWVKRKG